MKIIILTDGYYAGVCLQVPWLEQRELIRIGKLYEGKYFFKLRNRSSYDSIYPKYIIFNFGDE
jgi:hypothetical protein